MHQQGCSSHCQMIHCKQHMKVLCSAASHLNQSPHYRITAVVAPLFSLSYITADQLWQNAKQLMARSLLTCISFCTIAHNSYSRLGAKGWPAPTPKTSVLELAHNLAETNLHPPTYPRHPPYLHTAPPPPTHPLTSPYLPTTHIPLPTHPPEPPQPTHPPAPLNLPTHLQPPYLPTHPPTLPLPTHPAAPPSLPTHLHDPYPPTHPRPPNLPSPLHSPDSHVQAATPVCIVHGPFGCGKSSLLVALIQYLLAQRVQQGSGLQGCRVLLSAHTNIAVDRLMTGLMDSGCTGKACSGSHTSCLL